MTLEINPCEDANVTDKHCNNPFSLKSYFFLRNLEIWAPLKAMQITFIPKQTTFVPTTSFASCDGNMLDVF